MLFIVLMCAVRTATAQDPCETNFKALGDPRNGASYVSFVTIPNLDTHSALGQIERMTLAQGLTVGAETYSDNEGNLTLHPADLGLIHTQQGYPIVIKADTVSHELLIAAKLNQGRTVTADTMKATLCGLLTQVTMDDAGAAKAAAAHAQTHG
jgi:hypothetical protein